MKIFINVILFLFVWNISFSQEIASTNFICFEGATCFELPKSVSVSQLNDYRVVNNCMITSFSFQLFNRWGQVVKESSAMTVPLIWGSSDQPKGKKTKKQKKTSAIPEKALEQGVYFYIITFTLQGSNSPEKQTGNLTIF
jgi:hypothetical protein